MKPRRTRALQGFALVLTKGRQDCMAGSIQQKLQRVGLGEFAKRLFKRKEDGSSHICKLEMRAFFIRTSRTLWGRTPLRAHE